LVGKHQRSDHWGEVGLVEDIRPVVTILEERGVKLWNIFDWLKVRLQLRDSVNRFQQFVKCLDYLSTCQFFPQRCSIELIHLSLCVLTFSQYHSIHELKVPEEIGAAVCASLNLVVGFAK
jgi:hypothetical protein